MKNVLFFFSNENNLFSVVVMAAAGLNGWYIFDIMFMLYNIIYLASFYIVYITKENLKQSKQLF